MKEGLQVELETEDGIYSMTIRVIQAEIAGQFEQNRIGT